ncbi:AraC-like DNA-binding protein [Flavobacterium sp. 90]|uniref:helix-turn-helix domain-containing protein n=1 Tax=unclassified Flavobacterium TaxID=196869 RepID=UPI000EABDD71|nr:MULTISPECIES: helix-turn-helix domain-containing protein [unclassified Flavobacterium]RKR11880.1 AraC-like DNA-binding protein [Flavobacterium sp. 81]TCK55654.1 AraC-like DNA-binding protein [Flavobacterium sp. 90]
MIFNILLSIAIFQGIVLGFIILKSPLFYSIANKYLSYAIFTLSLLILNLVLERLELYEPFPVLRFIDDIEWMFVFPVFIFLFIVHQVNHPIRNSKKNRLLFIPFIYSTVTNVFYDCDVVAHIFKIPVSVKSAIESLKDLDFFIILLFLPFMAIYTYRFIKFSKDKQEKKWITFFWIQAFIIPVSWLLAILVYFAFQYDVSNCMVLLALFSTLLIHLTSYYGIFKYRLASDQEGIASLLNKKIPACAEDFSENIILKKESEINNLELLTKENPHFKKLEILFEVHQIYRDHTLNREKVAEQLGISAGYVSQVVNAITGDNFANYINNYRVEAVKKMILDSEYEKYSLLAIGLESGFTSKTTFHNAFKKATGMTPNTYRNTHK